MVFLYQFPPAWQLPSLSPFCMKVETYLRMTGVDYKPRVVVDPRRAPKGKLPYIEDGDDTVSDSQHIIEHLKRRYGDRLDERLGVEQRALGHAMRRLCEESLYFPTLYSRWIDPAGFVSLKRDVFSALPPIIRSITPRVARRNVENQLYQQGIGRHSREQIYAHGCDDIDALSVLVGDREFAVDDEPSSFDATLYSFLALNLVPPVHTPLKVRIEAKHNLVHYCARMKERYYP
jgi:glutathione S-transferase